LRLAWERMVLSTCPSLQVDCCTSLGTSLARFTFHFFPAVKSCRFADRFSQILSIHEILKFFSESHLKDKVLPEPELLAYLVKRLSQIYR
jgi:hypothetical protein